MKKVYILLFSLLFFMRIGLAQGPPIQTDTPIMLGLAGSGVRGFSKIIYKKSAKTSLTVLVTPLIVPVNLFSDRFQAGLIVPFKQITIRKSAQTNRVSGMGDAAVYVKYLLYQKNGRNETLRIAAKTTLKFANGSASATPSPGSGSTDVLVSSVAAWIKHRTGIYAEGIFALNGQFNGRNYGNAFYYNLAFAWRALPVVYDHYPMKQLNIYLELNGEAHLDDIGSDRQSFNNAYALIFLSPGLQYVGGARWLLESSVQLPLTDTRSANTLKDSWRFSLGFRFLFVFFLTFRKDVPCKLKPSNWISAG